MWTRKELKQKARHAINRNYWRAVVVCVVLVFFAGAYVSSFPANATIEELPANFKALSNTDVVDSIIRSFYPDAATFTLDDLSGSTVATRGVLAGLFNNITKSGSFAFGILNSLNQFFFQDQIWAGVIILIGAIFSFFYWFFIGNLLRVGECRFFMENSHYSGTAVNRVLFLFKIRKLWNVAFIMFLRTLYTVLWSFTIVGGFIKGYSYRMIPYILAENPTVTRQEAFALSREMMRGNKWNAFVLDVSFIWWHILSAISFGLLNFFFLNPYVKATDTELYFALREWAIYMKEDATEKLNDTCLVPENNGAAACYPVDCYPIPEHPSFRWLNSDFNRKYTLQNYILLFFAFALIGWIWEVCVDLFQLGIFVNRGTLFGPWLPIYGTVGVLVVMLLRRWANNLALTFLLVMFLCAIIEYFTSWALETFRNESYWDYHGYFLNINGRICLEGLLVFGLGGCLGIYLLAPALDDLFNKISVKVKPVLCVVLISLFLVDLVISAMNPQKERAIKNSSSSSTSIATAYTPPENEVLPHWVE